MVQISFHLIDQLIQLPPFHNVPLLLYIIMFEGATTPWNNRASGYQQKMLNLNSMYVLRWFVLITHVTFGRAVADLGQQWEKVSQRVGRMSSDCRDRYRNHIINRDVRVNGTIIPPVILYTLWYSCSILGVWTKKEEEELTRIVTDMTVKQGKDIDNDVFWGRVSELMGGKRGRQQCRIKW